MPASGKDRPDVLIAKQLVRGFFGEQQIARLRADAAQNAKDRLHEQRRLDNLAVQAIGQIVQMTNIVTFEFEPRAVAFTKLLDNARDIFEGVAENEIIGVFQIRLLPGEFPIFHAGGGGGNIKVHAAHVQAAHLRARQQPGRQPFFKGHAKSATGGDVDDGVRALLDHRQKSHEHGRVWRGRAINRIARM